MTLLTKEDKAILNGLSFEAQNNLLLDNWDNEEWLKEAHEFIIKIEKGA